MRRAVYRSATRPAPREEPATLEVQAKFFRGLGDPTRLRILDLLREGERTVSDLVQALGAPQGRVSNHLACLRWCGYVTASPRGRYTYYRIKDKKVHDILELARQMVADNAEHIWACTRIRD